MSMAVDPDTVLSTAAAVPAQQEKTQSDSSLKIHTYHCIACSQLLLATSLPLSSLPTRRSPPALDGALILPLSSPHGDESQAGPELMGDVDGGVEQPPAVVLVNVVKDRRPVIIRREDGFEKRVVGRCRRCKVGVGYWIMKDGEGKGEGEIVYLLPGGLVGTEEMMKDVEEAKGSGMGG